MARSCQVKALTLPPAHHNITGVLLSACVAVTPSLSFFRLWMDLPLSAPRHLSITRFTATLMTLIMWRGHMARRSVCVCASTYAGAIASALPS